MEYEILDALDDLRYVEKIDEQGLQDALKDIQKFSQILEWVCNEMKSVSNLEESITRVEKSEDLNAFHMELNSLLKELGCPYEQVMNGSPAERFEGEEKRKIILNFLLAELQASRIDHVKNRKQLKVELSESSTARLLREMLQTLGIPKPPVGIPMAALLSKLNERITDILKKMPPKLKGSAFFVGQLSPKQWEQIDQLNNEFRTEYVIRREMLLKRLDVTIQSFHWSDRLKNKKDDINRIFRQQRDQLDINPSVQTSEILAARSDLAIIEKTSSASVRKNTKSAVNTVVIGRVPDRGGRPNECQPPPPEMPPWQQRQGGGGGPSGQQGWSQGPQTQRNYGEGRGARGASQQRPKVQGGWSDHGQQQQNYSQQQNQSHGSYNQPQYQQSTQYSQPQTHQGSYGGVGGAYQQQQHQQQGGNQYQDRGGYQGRGQGNQGNYERDQGNARGGGGGGYRGGGGGGGGHRGGGGYRGGGGSGRHQY